MARGGIARPCAVQDTMGRAVPGLGHARTRLPRRRPTADPMR
ncbi:MAG: hypothetical protein NTZ05_21975 [Chloroflexi bacterium]|nr:hypothetical protein [Chloroflexota bacterium]